MCVANGLHVPPIAYKLRSLSDLPGLILQVAGTPTHGVLVSVLVSAVVYTRILVSDRMGACPYRPFSNKNINNISFKCAKNSEGKLQKNATRMKM